MQATSGKYSSLAWFVKMNDMSWCLLQGFELDWESWQDAAGLQHNVAMQRWLDGGRQAFHEANPNWL